jgi:hypothetical protein
VTAATSAIAAFMAPIGMITCGKNPRRDLGDLSELTESVRRHGVLLPLLVERHHRGGLRAHRRHVNPPRSVGDPTVRASLTRAIQALHDVVATLPEPTLEAAG